MSRVLLGLWCCALLAQAAPTWQDRQELLQLRLAAAPAAATAADERGSPAGRYDRNFAGDMHLGALPAEVVTTPRPEDYLMDDDLPETWDWRSVTLAPGLPPTSFASRVRNQFLPKQCGSCWAHAATAVLGARWRIHLAKEIDFSVQYLVNCAKDGGPDDNSSKGCYGGSAYGAFAYVLWEGAVDSSCLAYVGETQKCDALGTCQQHLGWLTPVKPATPVRYFTSEFGHVKGELAVRKEIFARGPISCCMATTDAFHNYTGGVFSSAANNTFCMHLVTVLGFAGEANQAHWLVQNSFGTVWGEDGHFRIKRASALQDGEHNLGIESFCAWTMPASHQQHSHHEGDALGPASSEGSSESSMIV